LENYTAFDISLVTGLPFFIDLLLLFRTSKAEYQELYNEIIGSGIPNLPIETEREITVLESKISELRSNSMSVGEIEETLDSALVNLTSIDKTYCESAHYEKRKLIGPIYPEKFTLRN